MTESYGTMTGDATGDVRLLDERAAADPYEESDALASWLEAEVNAAAGNELCEFGPASDGGAMRCTLIGGKVAADFRSGQESVCRSFATGLRDHALRLLRAADRLDTLATVRQQHDLHLIIDAETGELHDAGDDARESWHFFDTLRLGRGIPSRPIPVRMVRATVDVTDKDAERPAEFPEGFED